jgi:hypothetical protein
MKILGRALLAGALALTVGTVRADDTGQKVRRGARHVGQTVEHGAKAVGHGASKIYHDAASGVHRTIAKNAHTQRTAQAQLRDAARHRRHSVAETRRSKKEMNQAGKAAGRVTQ